MITNRFVLAKREVNRNFYLHFGLDPIGFRILNNLNEDTENTFTCIFYLEKIVNRLN